MEPTTTPRHVPVPPPISQALRSAIEAAETRTTEGQRVFGPVSTLWDTFLESDEVRKLPVRLRSPLIALCKEVHQTATRHFDAFIKGSYPPRIAREPTTYAQAAVVGETRAEPVTCEQPATREPITRKRPSAHEQPETLPPLLRGRQPRLETRLFVRLAPEHKARKAGGFAILCALRDKLGEQGRLLKEVQPTKTGYALCTGSLEGLAALETHAELITQSFGDCKVERQDKWTTYRLDNVPRTVRLLSGLQQVLGSTLRTSITDSINQTPTQVVETAQSAQSHLPSTSWFVSFRTESHTPLPKTLRILGVSVTASIMLYKPKTVQCSRCYHWHNTRSCVRTQRCRICGSSNHSEEEHTTRCSASTPHTCPPRCLHCGGPHTATDPNCLLRLTYRGPKTKSQRLVITETMKAARKRACVAAKCSWKGPQDTQMREPSPKSNTPIRARSPEPTSPVVTPTPPARRYDKGGHYTAQTTLFTDRLRAARPA